MHAVIIAYNMYLTDPPAYHSAVSALLDEFDAAHAMIVLSRRPVI
jgi:hypothetical protein